MEELGREVSQEPGSVPEPGRWRINLSQALAGAASRVTGAVASAQELLRDPQLRRCVGKEIELD